MSKIKLLASQVPIYWELIKYIAVKVDEVDGKDLQPYLNELLHALLNEKAQCFVSLDDKRIVVTIFITRLMIDKITGEKYLFIQNMYSFKATDNETREQESVFLKEFAKKEQCTYMSLRSRNKRIWELAELNGYKEKARVFEFRFED